MVQGSGFQYSHSDEPRRGIWYGANSTLAKTGSYHLLIEGSPYWAASGSNHQLGLGFRTCEKPQERRGWQETPNNT